MLLIQPCEVSDNSCHSLGILSEETSEILLESLGISTNGFTTNPSPLWSWNLWLSDLNAPALSLFPAMWHMAMSDWVACEGENLDVDPWPVVFLQNMELRKSALGEHATRGSHRVCAGNPFVWHSRVEWDLVQCEFWAMNMCLQRFQSILRVSQEFRVEI